MKTGILLALLFSYSCSDSFELDPTKPIEIGIESINSDDSDYYTINVYMINHQPVRGVQIEISPNSFFEVDSAYGGRSKKNNFELPHNKEGVILCYSLSGSSIPESSNSTKEKNILFSVAAKLINPINSPINIIPIIADNSAKKIDYITTPFEFIGK